MLQLRRLELTREPSPRAYTRGLHTDARARTPETARWVGAALRHKPRPLIGSWAEP